MASGGRPPHHHLDPRRNRLGLVPARHAPTARRLAVAAGIFDMGANIAFLLALRTGLLGLVAVLSSLYPIITIALARSVYHEGIGRTQASGIAIALAGTALIAAG